MRTLVALLALALILFIGVTLVRPAFEKVKAELEAATRELR